ncbi:MAG: rhodanese-like domain-containing protein [Gammaproteobacteria bacterium]|nr:rhodanese-like domain-containing protein [Gammaproteobacteria bacterium]MCY4210070.1 rhodanese-like domain-containing protein [Gammaproteobacteria bacterium]MCY4337524.1 rhodanese-like domain-containing protein [Gammaproteobacteria bacterium]
MKALCMVFSEVPCIIPITRYLFVTRMEKLPEFIANHLWLVCLFVAILALLLWNVFGSSMSGLSQVGPTEVTRLLNHDKALLLDLRTSADFAAGHIISARNIPTAELEDRKKELQKFKDNPIIFCCNRNLDGVKAGRILKLAGFEKIYSLKGGLEAWRSANLPITRE